RAPPGVVPDAVYRGMFRIRLPGGGLSPMVNLTHARDALRTLNSGPSPGAHRLAPKRRATQPAARQRLLRDAEIAFGGEVSSCCFPEGLASRTYSPWIFAALRIGHHFSISAFCCAASASGVCCSRGGISWPCSVNRCRTVASAKAACTAELSLVMTSLGTPLGTHSPCQNEA